MSSLFRFFIHITLILGLLATSSKLFPQGYKINLQLKGASGLKAHLAYYIGQNQQLVQTKEFDKHSKLTFEGTEPLPTGIYLVAIENNGHFDMLIKNETEFSLSADLANPVTSMKVKNSKENQLFFDYQKKIYKLKSQLTELDSSIVKHGKNNDSLILFNNQKADLEKELFSEVELIKKNHPESYLSKILITMELADPDKVNYADQEILRTPFYTNLIRLFIKKNINFQSQFIISETTKFLASLKESQANYQYAAEYLLNFYNTFYKNGINEVFVYLADNYFLPDKAKWLSPEILATLKERRNFLAQGLPGMQSADLVLESTIGEYVSLHQLNSKMTFLYFWSVNCGHCSKSTEILKQNYEKLLAKGILIYAVNIDKDKESWLKKVEENQLEWINCYDPMETSQYRDKYYVYGSPLLFIIGQNKKILAVKNGETEIEEMINQIIAN